MDPEEKQLVEEDNTLRARDLDVAEKRTAALLAILRASLLTVAAVAAAGWGISVLSRLDLSWTGGLFMGSLVSASASATVLVIYLFGMTENWPVAGRRWAAWITAFVLSSILAAIAGSRF